MLHNEEKCINLWLENIQSEYDYWNKSARNNKNSYITQRYSIIDYDKSLLETKREIKVLDLGCGPRGALKDKYHLPSNIQVYSCDPLAFLYKDILEKNNIKIEKEIKFALAELLSFFYPENFFDYIIVQNALDHSINPQLAIEECLKILKKDGTIYMCHAENEAFTRNFSGLHQWNFSLNKTNDFIISNKISNININEIYKNYIHIVNKKIMGTQSNHLIESKITKTKDLVSKTNNNITELYLTSFMSFLQATIIKNPNLVNFQKNIKNEPIEKLKKTLLYLYSQK